MWISEESISFTPNIWWWQMSRWARYLCFRLSLISSFSTVHWTSIFCFSVVVVLLCLNSFLIVDNTTPIIIASQSFSYSFRVILKVCNLYLINVPLFFTRLTLNMHSLTLNLFYKTKNSFVYILYKYDFGVIHFMTQSWKVSAKQPVYWHFTDKNTQLHTKQKCDKENNNRGKTHHEKRMNSKEFLVKWKRKSDLQWKTFWTNQVLWTELCLHEIHMLKS